MQRVERIQTKETKLDLQSGQDDGPIFQNTGFIGSIIWISLEVKKYPPDRRSM